MAALLQKVTPDENDSDTSSDEDVEPDVACVETETSRDPREEAIVHELAAVQQRIRDKLMAKNNSKLIKQASLDA